MEWVSTTSTTSSDWSTHQYLLIRFTTIFMMKGICKSRCKQSIYMYIRNLTRPYGNNRYLLLIQRFCVSLIVNAIKRYMSLKYQQGNILQVFYSLEIEREVQTWLVYISTIALHETNMSNNLHSFESATSVFMAVWLNSNGIHLYVTTSVPTCLIK